MLDLNFEPFPILHTQRLQLRWLSDQDVKEVYALRSDADVMKYIPRPLATSIEDALDHIKTIHETIAKKEGINWAITLKENDTLIGLIGLYRIKPETYRSELGYILSPLYHNLGYISEAVDEVLSYAFMVLNFNSIEAIIDPHNFASEKVLQKTGFIKEGHLVEHGFWNGKFTDTVIYSMLKRNFKSEY
jgi:[ribosomal protein S5]-alanine N-acetyltransferase